MAKVFEILAEDSTSAIKKVLVYQNKKEAISEVESNGYEIVRIKDVTSEWKLDIDFLIDTLAKAQYGQTEQDIIRELVESWNAKIEKNPDSDAE